MLTAGRGSVVNQLPPPDLVHIFSGCRITDIGSEAELSYSSLASPINWKVDIVDAAHQSDRESRCVVEGCLVIPPRGPVIPVDVSRVDVDSVPPQWIGSWPIGSPCGKVSGSGTRHETCTYLFLKLRSARHVLTDLAVGACRSRFQLKFKFDRKLELIGPP